MVQPPGKFKRELGDNDVENGGLGMPRADGFFFMTSCEQHVPGAQVRIILVYACGCDFGLKTREIISLYIMSLIKKMNFSERCNLFRSITRKEV